MNNDGKLLVTAIPILLSNNHPLSKRGKARQNGNISRSNKEKMYQNCLERYTHIYLAIKHFPLKEITQDRERRYI